MIKKILQITCITLILSCGKKTETKEKVNIMAKKVSQKQIYHNDTIIDNYAWMRLSDAQKEADNPDAQTKDVLDYLNVENEYLQDKMNDTKSLQDELFEK